MAAANPWPSKFTGVVYYGEEARGEMADGTLIGDFNEMILMRKFMRTLFIFNGNLDAIKSGSTVSGAGSSVIRPFNEFGEYKEHSHSFEIPTYSRAIGVFTSLTPQVHEILHKRFRELQAIVDKQRKAAWKGYDRVCFPMDPDTKKFAARKDPRGRPQFTVGEDVIEFITLHIPYYCGVMDGSLY